MACTGEPDDPPRRGQGMRGGRLRMARRGPRGTLSC